MLWCSECDSILIILRLEVSGAGAHTFGCTKQYHIHRFDGDFGAVFGILDTQDFGDKLLIVDGESKKIYLKQCTDTYH